ncbi:hypothetical protein BC826DRAFT_606549 [Russula brevipes]|nr:hypothetical protein BC826DRAFT_606549 [Russula brevipes]
MAYSYPDPYRLNDSDDRSAIPWLLGHAASARGQVGNSASAQVGPDYVPSTRAGTHNPESIDFRHPSPLAHPIPHSQTHNPQCQGQHPLAHIQLLEQLLLQIADRVPKCRYPGCSYTVTVDQRTHELSEYCSRDHMQSDVRRGVPLCPACKRCPRRLTTLYCGSSCERWASKSQRSQQQATNQQQQRRR